MSVGPVATALTRHLPLFALPLFPALVGSAVAAEPVIASATVQSTPDRQMGHEIDRVRAAHGLRHLASSRPLRSASYRYARWLVLHQRFRHAVELRPPGFSAVGEVLERHFDGGRYVRRTVRLWMKSPSHRKVLLNPKYREGGASLVRGRLHAKPVSVWVLRLGRR